MVLFRPQYILQVAIVVIPILIQPAAYAANRVERSELKFVDRGQEIAIPLITVLGNRTGPTLAIVAGIHGSEYAPIIAVQKLLPMLVSAELTGIVKVIPVANPASFYKRTIYYSGLDEKNLNRSFPGSVTGTYSEKLAHLLTTEVIEKCDYFLDIHAGDANEALMSYAAYDADTENPANREKSLQMAKALNLPRIVRGKNRPRSPNTLLYTTNTARDRGKPNVAIECGELGRWDSCYVHPITSGVENLLRYLGMLPGPVKQVKGQMYVDNGTSVVSQHDGIYYPKRRAGDTVQKGEELGLITNLAGEPLASIKAPVAGFVLYSLATPPISAGEPIATIGVLTDR